MSFRPCESAPRADHADEFIIELHNTFLIFLQRKEAKYLFVDSGLHRYAWLKGSSSPSITAWMLPFSNPVR
jgi:hypothetical protein